MQSDALFESCRACVVHARHLIESAKLIQHSGRPNIAYHLTTLALEELGRRELFKLHEMSVRVGKEPAWVAKAMQDHVRKLFWCFYSIGGISDVTDDNQFLGTSEAASDIHNNRLNGLYVDRKDTSLSIPADAISSKQADSLIGLAELVAAAAESEQPRSVSQEEIELQIWLLDAFDNPELRKQMLAKASIENLKATNDVAAWARKMRSDIEASEAQLKELVDAELRRAPSSLGRGDRDRWRIRVKLRTISHSIRPKPLKNWNEKAQWIKFHPQQGALSKEELIAEIGLGDNVPLASLATIASSFAIQLVMALNLATSGFWWWPLGPNQQRAFDRIRDLDNHLDVVAEDHSFKVIAAKVPLTDVHMDNLRQCWAALPDPREHRAGAYEHYLQGLTFTAINCVQWRCEGHAFASFTEAFMLFMREARYPNPDEPMDAAAGRFVKDKFPDLDPSEFEDLLKNIRSINRKNKRLPSVNNSNVYFIKLLCETIFRDVILGPTLRAKLRP